MSFDQDLSQRLDRCFHKLTDELFRAEEELERRRQSCRTAAKTEKLVRLQDKIDSLNQRIERCLNQMEKNV